MDISKISKTLLLSFIAVRIQVPDSTIALSTPLPSPTPTTAAIQFKVNPNLLDKIKTSIGRRAWVSGAVVAKIEGTTLTVSKDNVIYTVATDTNTMFVRKYGGKSSLAEVSVNDELNILGKWSNEERTEIKATRIRNLSIRKMFGAFFGEVKSINDNAILVTTLRRGDQTIVVGDSTKLVNRKMEVITISDIKIGHRIRIKGIWDLESKTITEVTQIKDFTIPVVRPSPLPPTPTQ